LNDKRGAEPEPEALENGREPVMKRLYYQDSYGRWHQDRHRENRPGLPAKWAVIALMLLAGLLVLGSLMQSAYHAVKP